MLGNHVRCHLWVAAQTAAQTLILQGEVFINKGEVYTAYIN